MDGLLVAADSEGDRLEVPAALAAVRQEALLVVLADEGLDVARLHVESRPTVERLGAMLTGA